MIWYIKQLLPLTYRSHYRDGDGEPHFCVWQMWFGRWFHVEDMIVTRMINPPPTPTKGG